MARPYIVVKGKGNTGTLLFNPATNEYTAKYAGKVIEKWASTPEAGENFISSSMPFEEVKRRLQILEHNTDYMYYCKLIEREN